MVWYDAHIHLDQYERKQVGKLLPQWRSAGVAGVLAVATDYASCQTVLRLKAYAPDFVHIAFGYHPEQPLPTASERNRLFQLIQKERSNLSAIGEVGLPHYRLRELSVKQTEPYEQLLKQFAELARDERLPLALHAVHDKAATALEILRETGVHKAYFHWLKAPHDVIRAIVAAGYYISVTPEVCYRSRDQALVRLVPLNHLLVETDGPWPYDGEFTGQRTSPLMLKRVIQEIARLQSVSVDAASEQLAKNFRHLIQLPPTIK